MTHPFVLCMLELLFLCLTAVPADATVSTDRSVCNQDLATPASIYPEKPVSAMIQVKSSTASSHEFLQRVSRDADVPPEQKVMIAQMIRPEPWNCDFMIPGDPRNFSCRLTPNGDGLTPNHIVCGRDNTCSTEHANAYRTQYTIGPLPCCLTSPYCAAPVCNPSVPAAAPTVCTKRSAEENVAFLKLPSSWPAYHGFGGAFELDVLKYMDLLACNDLLGCPAKVDRPFDLAIDVGANTGFFTEKMTVRNFAKNYILIEADPDTVPHLQSRWGSESWKEAWYTKQIALKEGELVPEFEIIHQAVSNETGEVIDLCKTQGSMESSGCEVSVASLDSLLPSSLTTDFQHYLQQAQSVFVKIDTEGMDELVLRGMQGILSEQRGVYENGSPRYLVNFLQFEWSPFLMKTAKEREGFEDYNIETTIKFLETIGFETFFIGPRYLPLSHGSWTSEYRTFTEDPHNSAGALINYDKFDGRLFHHCYQENCAEREDPTFTTDVLAIRASHPRATELKVALGACQESVDFDFR